MYAIRALEYGYRAGFRKGLKNDAKLFGEVALWSGSRPGGYTRILRLGTRHGDGAEMAYLELVGYEYKPASKDEKAKKGAEKKENRWMEKFGDWMRVNAESIHATRASPFEPGRRSRSRPSGSGSAWVRWKRMTGAPRSPATAISGR